MANEYTVWAINCSKELNTMGYTTWQYDGDTYDWVISHKNSNGASPETCFTHKQLVDFTIDQRKKYNFYCVGCRQTGAIHCSDPGDCNNQEKNEYES